MFDQAAHRPERLAAAEKNGLRRLARPHDHLEFGRGALACAAIQFEVSHPAQLFGETHAPFAVGQPVLLRKVRI